MKSDKKFREMTIAGIASDNRNLQPVVILKEKNGERELYIWIGPVEAMALQRALNKEVFQRPLTHELMRNIIEKAGMTLEHIEIDDLKDHTYYATIYLKGPDSKLLTVDARPSDSLVLATWNGVPIFVSEDVIEGMVQEGESEGSSHKVVFTQEDIEQTDEELTKILERMVFTRSVGIDSVSGPLGIIDLGGEFARSGFVKFVFFLAIISANLAVINFLPLPIVDGGLMVFLIIEKIKGAPVSLRVQVATQMIGLFLLIGFFLYITFNDAMRLWG
jgi:bifunctional DNase/RNase